MHLAASGVQNNAVKGRPRSIRLPWNSSTGCFGRPQSRPLSAWRMRKEGQAPLLRAAGALVHLPRSSEGFAVP